MLRPYSSFPFSPSGSGFPHRGESVPDWKTALLLKHQAFERRESEDGMIESAWIHPPLQGEPPARLYVYQ